MLHSMLVASLADPQSPVVDTCGSAAAGQFEPSVELVLADPHPPVIEALVEPEDPHVPPAEFGCATPVTDHSL